MAKTVSAKATFSERARRAFRGLTHREAWAFIKTRCRTRKQIERAAVEGRG
jgi:hypothetical protein